ncbi:hypothetical protein TKK_0001381 [Trichogramma kaykai]|uniref:Cysteine proteinase n=1 Tax=Trichogramma kaykai TaxID=54128 RepID=A0ABD2WQW9_9HYME
MAAAMSCWRGGPLLMSALLLAAVSQYWPVHGTAAENLSLDQVDGLLVQSALGYLRDKQPYYKAELVSAQRSEWPPFVIYRLTLLVYPTCKATDEFCAVSECSLDVRQREHEPGVIDIMRESVHCRPVRADSKSPDESVIAELEKQIKATNQPSFDKEVHEHSEQDRPFVAVRANQSHYCPGCPYELNPSLPGLLAFGQQAMRAMDEAGQSDFKHKVVAIVKVTRAVPPGSNVVRYQLLMDIGESSCLKNSHIEISECSLQSNLPVRSCLVTYEEQPTVKNSRKITANNCTDQLLNNDNEINADVHLSSSASPAAVTPTSNPVDDETQAKTEYYDQIAQEAQEVFHMDLSSKDVEAAHSKILLDRQSSDDQETAKFSDKVKEFDEFLKDFDVAINPEASSTSTVAYSGEPVTEPAIVKEQVPEEEPKLVADEKQPLVENIRSKRSTKSLLENNKPMLRKLAIKAIQQIDELDEDNLKKRLIDVTSTERERKDHAIVYYLTLEVAPTDCFENDESTECLDEVTFGGRQSCKVSLATDEKRPLESPKLLNYECKIVEKPETERFKRQTLGAPHTHSPDDPEVQRFAHLGLTHLSQKLESDFEPMLVKVKDVTVQVVSGLKYKIRADIGSSTCRKGEKTGCQLEASKGVKECLMEIWSQPWLDKGNPKIISVTCEPPERRRRRRSLKGQNYSEKMKQQYKKWKEEEKKEKQAEASSVVEKSRKRRSLRGQHYSEQMLMQSRQLKEERLFSEFVSKYNKTYETENEKDRRFEIFRKNLDVIEELQRNEQGTGRYGVTRFADLTKDEFRSRYLGLNPALRSENDIPLPKAEIPDIELPKEFDWRQRNAVTPVKNQGQCGSCWAFSVTGNVEGQYAIKHGKLLSLSEQELVDCDQLDDGCNGGLPDQAYRAIEELGGLELESDYPYDAQDEKCHFNKNKVRVSVVSGLNITSNETQMAQWLVQNGPMSIGINANAMQFYFGGVSHPYHFLCSPDNLDHGVLIVGYGIKTYPIFKKTMPYWLIKNSWGEHWGEQGYYRVYRGDGTCGVNKMVTSAVIA